MQKNISKREDIIDMLPSCVTFFMLKNMKRDFITPHEPNSNFKLRQTHKFYSIY